MNYRIVAITTVALAVAGLSACDRARDERASPASPSRSGTASTAPAPATVTPGATANTPNTQVAGTSGERTAGEAVSDATITAKVKAALMAEKGVAATDINVDTSSGNVTLSGRVADQAQAERASEVARGVDGVKAVDNKLSAGRS